MLAPLVAAALALHLSAQGTPPASSPGPAAPTGPSLLAAPAWSQLFTAPRLPGLDARPTTVVEAPSSTPRRKVVCGTTLIIVDSAVDPRFVVSPRPGAGEPTIRRMPKPMCGGAQR